jgi:hypothetical protein
MDKGVWSRPSSVPVIVPAETLLEAISRRDEGRLEGVCAALEGTEHAVFVALPEARGLAPGFSPEAIVNNQQ